MLDGAGNMASGLGEMMGKIIKLGEPSVLWQFTKYAIVGGLVVFVFYPRLKPMIEKAVKY